MDVDHTLLVEEVLVREKLAGKLSIAAFCTTTRVVTNHSTT